MLLALVMNNIARYVRMYSTRCGQSIHESACVTYVCIWPRVYKGREIEQRIY